MEKMDSGKQAEDVAKATVRLLFAFRDEVNTLAFYDDSEFTQHELNAKKLRADFYIAYPYSLLERGILKHKNKLIKQYIIKGSNFDLYDREYIKMIQNKANLRPSKKQNQYIIPNFYSSLNEFVAFLT
ncbi:MAG: hypothetical protein NTY07_15480 [Bacteroidia bacterium]|nr:hypothetical protein [Bacteroidia bacterium]